MRGSSIAGAVRASSLDTDLIKENPPLSGQRSIDQFGFVPIHPSILKQEISTVGFSAGLDMARNRNVRGGIEPVHIPTGARRRKRPVALLHVRGNRRLQILATELLFGDPPLQTSHVIIITSTGVHVEVGIAVRHIKIANDKLWVEISRVLHIRETVPLLSRTKKDVHPILLIGRVHHGNQVAGPEFLHVGAAPTDVRSVGVIGKIIVVIGGVGSQRNVLLAQVTHANCA